MRRPIGACQEPNPTTRARAAARYHRGPAARPGAWAGRPRHMPRLSVRPIVLAWLVMASAHSAPRAVTPDLAGQPTPAAVIADPQLSPDGRTIAFVLLPHDARAGRRGPTIHHVPVAGGRATPLVDEPGGAWSPRWSPDGRRLAFLARRADDAHAEIFVRETANGRVHRVTTHPTAPADLVWTHDSQLIFFSAADPDRAASDGDLVRDARAAGRRHLHVANLEGVVTQVTFGAYTVTDYTLSPSGSTIAMTRVPADRGPNSGATEVWVMDANGGNAHRLVAGAARAHRPDVSPDGSMASFLSAAPGSASAADAGRLMVVSRHGGEPRAITGVAATAIREARWLDDGRLAVLSDGQLFEVDARTGGARALTEGSPRITNWTWSRRPGVHLLTAAGADGAAEIYLLQPGQTLRKVARSF